MPYKRKPCAGCGAPISSDPRRVSCLCNKCLTGRPNKKPAVTDETNWQSTLRGGTEKLLNAIAHNHPERVKGAEA